MTIRSSLLVVGLAGLVGCACLFEDAFARQDEKVQEEKKDKKESNPHAIYYGVSSCNNKGCHGGDPPKTWIKDDKGKQLELLASCDEALVVEKKDRHNVAYKVLTEELGKRMQENLAKGPHGKAFAAQTKKPYAVTADPACLACHAVVIDDPKVLADSKRIGFNVEDGVGCAACHGADSRWIAHHALMVSAVKFRPLSPKQKEKDYGLINLRDPVRRTELCASCHVGSVKEKKFVTHEMYAAGHPPLPGFEIATFSNEEPRHWKLNRQRSEAVQKELGFVKGEQEETTLVLLGGVIAFRDTMTLLKEQARVALDNKKKLEKDSDLDVDDKLDLSNFDCYVCHHNLKKKDNWRQDPRYAKKETLGKVRGRDWSFRLVRLAAKYLDEKAKDGRLKKLDGALATLTKALVNPSGGDAAAIVKAATEAEELSAKMAGEIDKNRPVQDDLPKLLKWIEELFLDKGDWMDYDSARQVAWAAEIISREYAEPDAAPPQKEPLEVMFLRLRKGEDKEVAPHLSEFMKKVDDYQPEKFLEQMKKFLAR
jgi:hypothetical protein